MNNWFFSVQSGAEGYVRLLLNKTTLVTLFFVVGTEFYHLMPPAQGPLHPKVVLDFY